MPTYGAASQPAQSTFNYDALVATSLLNYNKTLKDNISASNIWFKLMHDKGMWDKRAGSLAVAEDLMYALSPVDTYSDYDELPLAPTEGITQAQFEWRQIAAPIAISEMERKKNKTRIINLLESKIMQAEMGMIDRFSKFGLWGSLAGSGTDIRTPYSSVANGSSAFDPLGALISYTPTVSTSVGNINQSTNAWWRNNSTVSAATTTTGLLQEFLTMKNNCSKGPGGVPDWILCDQTTWEWVSIALYNRFRTEVTEVGDYPFPTLKFQGTLISWDQYVGNVFENSSAGSTDTTTTTGGTTYFGNSKFMKMVTEEETDFIATDMVRPANQDAKYKHILWMGCSTVSNRRKLGVIGKIARTLTIS